MHSGEYVRRQAAADRALQERVTALVTAQGGTFDFDGTAARGDANVRRLLLMEAANQALDGLVQDAEERKAATRKAAAQKKAAQETAAQPDAEPEIAEPDDVVVAAVETVEEAPVKGKAKKST